MKKGFFIAVVVAIMLVMSVACVSADRIVRLSDPLMLTDIKISVNGCVIDEAVLISDNSVYVPVRGVLEAMGCEVEWNNEERSADIRYGEEKIRFMAVSDDVIITNDRMYVPVRYAAEALGFDIEWDDVNRSVIISSRDDVNEGVSFAMRLKNGMPKDRNYVISPLSIKYAMAMAANGADSDTRREITAALGIDDLSRYNVEVKSYIRELDSKGEDDCSPVFEIANSMWLNRDYIKDGDFSEEYKSLISDYYAGMANAVCDSDAVDEINGWCDNKTHHRISEITDNSDFLACVINAVYLRARWLNTFDEGATCKESFTDRDGEVSELDFMHQTEYFNYYEGDGIKAVELPYAFSDLSMYIILDDKGNTDIDTLYDKLECKRVMVSIPGFKLEYSLDATDILKSMGIRSAFDKDSTVPHFADMFNESVNDSGNAYISKVLHRAYINVNEDGTEAAAVTAVVMNVAMALAESEKVYEFKADRPFTYIIRDNSNGEVLFMGEYAYADVN